MKRVQAAQKVEQPLKLVQAEMLSETSVSSNVSADLGLGLARSDTVAGS